MSVNAIENMRNYKCKKRAVGDDPVAIRVFR